MLPRPSYEDLENRIADLERQISKYQSDAIKYQTIFNTFPYGITVSDQYGNIMEGNTAAEKLFEIGNQEHQGRSLEDPGWRMIRPDGSDMPSNEQADVKALKENRLVEDCEMGIVKPDDTVRWVNVTAAPLPIEEFGVIVIYSDITERKHAQTSLQESQEQLRLITDNLPDSFVYQYTQNEKERKFLFVSSGVERVFPGLRSRDVLNDATMLLNLIEPDLIDSFQKAVETSARLMTDFSMDVRARRPDGEPCWFHVHSRPHRSHAGQIVWDGVIIDINDRKQNEARVRMLARQRQLALDAANLGWWQYDPITRIAILDDRYRAIFGVSRSTLPNDEILQKIIHPDDLPSLWARVEAALNPVSPEPYAAQYRIIRPDVDVRWIESFGIAIFEGEKKDRKAIEFVGTVADITERKLTEEQLRASQERYSQILQTAMDGVVRVNRQGRIIEVNHAYCRMTGYASQELTLMNIEDLDIAHSAKTIEENMILVLKNGETRFESRQRRKDGSIFEVEVSAQIQKGPEEIEFVVFLRDITDKKNAEKALKRRADFERLISEISKDFVSSSPEEIDAAMDRALEAIGIFTGADRAYVFQFSDEQKARMDNTHEWCADGIEPQIHDLQNISVQEELPWFIDRISKNKIFHIPDVAELPPEAWRERHHFELQSIRSLIVVTMQSGNQKIGFLGFDAVRKRRYWSSDDQSLLQLIGETITHALNRKRIEDALIKNEQFLADIFNSIHDGVSVLNPDLTIRHVNKVIKQWYVGKSPIEGKKCFQCYQNSNTPCVSCPTLLCFKSGKTETDIVPGPPNSDVQWIELYSYPMKDSKTGEITGAVEFARDVTKRKQMEAHILQTQKMESIGLLAGGIAHDFNNILFPILGLSEMLMEDLAPDSLEHENVLGIYKAGKRGSDLVKQILAFSRKAEQQRMPVRVQQILRDVIKLCRSSIPADITIKQDIQSDCALVEADPTRVHQIAMNLITNAYHAVEPKSGEITIVLKEIEIEFGQLPESDLRPGKYALLSISDTGGGIDPAIRDKIFEPYFTTKDQGKGTGLGLAVVYGIVKEHHGGITVTSKLGAGTTFEVHLPVITKTEISSLDEKKEEFPKGHGHILLVDDERTIASLEKQMLERLGYEVTVCLSSLEALIAFEADPGLFDLVISDMAMPNMTGDRLALALIAIRPDIPVIICTGFSERIDKKRAAAIGIKGFLMKPVAKGKMAKVVRKVLEEAKGRANP